MIQAWVIWNLCDLENKIISVERIFQYTSIPSEPPLTMGEDRLNHHWPSKGEVELRDIHVHSIIFSSCHLPFLSFFIVGCRFDTISPVSVFGYVLWLRASICFIYTSKGWSYYCKLVGNGLGSKKLSMTTLKICKWSCNFHSFVESSDNWCLKGATAQLSLINSWEICYRGL